MPAAELVPMIKMAQLDGKYRCLDTVHPGIGANHRMPILRRTSMIAKQAQFVGFAGIVSCHSARVTIGPQVLAGIETEASQAARSPDFFAIARASVSLGSIFNNPQAVRGRKFSDLPEIHCSPIKVHGDDRPCARRDHPFCGMKVEVEGGRIHVGKYWLGTHIADRLRRSEKRVGGNENFVPWADIGDL